jgi:stage III sporulation protein AG
MKVQWKPPEGAVWKLLDQYKYILIVIAAGVILLLWPTGDREQKVEAGQRAQAGDVFDLSALEEKLSQTLSKVEGAGEVTVTLSVKNGMEQVLASDRTTSVTERGSSVEEETVLVNSGGSQEAVLLTQRYPTFQGALVVCQGGDDAEIRLTLTQAVSALTGLGADRITVCKGGG